MPWLTIALFIALAYDGWIFYNRWSYARNAKASAQLKEGQADRRIVNAIGGNNLKILDFYGPTAIRRGQSANICYGVNDAKTVRIEPPVEQLYPAYSHCFQVTPRADTEYKLIASDAAGHTQTKSITIRVLH